MNKKKPYANLNVVILWLSEAKVWMDTAMYLDFKSNRPQNNIHNTDDSKLNVAHVCTGLAFELAYKSLLAAEFIPLKKTHSIQKLHEMLKKETRGIVEGYINKKGWKDSTHFLTYLNTNMAHPDRKYWMENPWKKREAGIGFVTAEGIMTIPGLAPILYKLVDLGWQNIKKARNYSYDLSLSIGNYITAKKDKAVLKKKVLESIKTFRNSYGYSVNLNQIIYHPTPKEFTKILDSSD